MPILWIYYHSFAVLYIRISAINTNGELRFTAYESAGRDPDADVYTNGYQACFYPGLRRARAVPLFEIHFFQKPHGAGYHFRAHGFVRFPHLRRTKVVRPADINAEQFTAD